MKKFLLLSTLTLLVSIGFCQNSYVQSGSIGVAKPANTEKNEGKFLYGPVKFRELNETIGERYIIVPLNKVLLKYGYSSFYKHINGEKTLITQKDDAGRILIFKSFDDKEATFEDTTGIIYTKDIFGKHISNVAPIYDIDEARKLYLNKTLWVKKNEVDTYNDSTGIYGEIKNMRFEPVKITNIVVGIPLAPVRFILKTEKNETAYLDVIVSGTNMNPKYLLEYMFENVFYTKDPKVTYKFTPAMWKKIKNNELEIGMTEDQVKLSYGYPDKINKSTGAGMANQWIYGDRYLYFRNGKLTTIQN